MLIDSIFAPVLEVAARDRALGAVYCVVPGSGSSGG